MADLASSLAQHAEDAIEIADTAVIAVVKQLKTSGTSPEALSRLDQILVAQKPGLSRIRDITVVDKDGRYLATSLPAKGGNLSDRSFFDRHRDDPGLGMLISLPIRSSVTGQRVITVSRRFQSADGSFAGVVFAIINLSYFADHYATFNMGHDGTIGLAAADGTLLAKYRPVEEAIGRNFRNGMLFVELGERSAGSYSTTSIVD